MFQPNTRTVGGLILGAIILACSNSLAQVSDRDEETPVSRSYEEVRVLARSIPAQSSIPSLERLRASVGLVSNGSDWVDPTRGRSGAKFLTVSYPVAMDMTPSLTPSLNPSLTPSAPVARETPRAAPVAAVPRTAPVAAVPVEGGRSTRPSSGSEDPDLSPCQDLRNKARRLREAASQCDSDVSNGVPYCNVSVTFTSPRIPDSLQPRSAESYADRFDAVAEGGSEQACSDYGGEGRIPTVTEHSRGYAWRSRPYAAGSRKRCMDSYLRDNYNDFVADTLVPYFSAGSIASRRYWKSVLETTVVKGSIMGALGVGHAYYSAKEYEALGKSLNEWGWTGILGRGAAVVGAANTAANIATAQAFLEWVAGTVVAGGGAFATTAHLKAYDACASEAP